MQPQHLFPPPCGEGREGGSHTRRAPPLAINLRGPHTHETLAPISPAARILLGVLFFILFFALWALATLSGFVSKTFLADPITMVRDGWDLLTKQGFAFDIGMTVWRVLGGFILAALVAVPVGILMGAFKPVEAFPRALYLLRALPAGLGLHPAA